MFVWFSPGSVRPPPVRSPIDSTGLVGDPGSTVVRDAHGVRCVSVDELVLPSLRGYRQTPSREGATKTGCAFCLGCRSYRGDVRSNPTVHNFQQSKLLNL